MASPGSPQSALVVLTLVGLAIAAAVSQRVIAALQREGGRVRATHFGPPDLSIALGLATFFAVMVGMSLAHGKEAAPITPDRLMGSAIMLGAVVFALGGYLYFRGFRFRELFGLGEVSAPRVVGWAVLLLVGAFPLVGVASALAQQLLTKAAPEQELVQLFRRAAQTGDVRMMGAILFTGVVVAPICEEILFRGFFYPVGKRFVGPWVSAVATSLLFAAFHGTLLSLAGLTVLALALVVAYERTGSLAVPITMHALFNGLSLTVLYLQASGAIAS